MKSQEKKALQTILTRNGMISSNLSYIYSYLVKKESFEISDETINYLKEVKVQYELFTKTLFSKKLENLKQLNINREDLINVKMTKLLENNQGVSNVVVHYLAEIVRIISSSGGSILNYSMDN